MQASTAKSSLGVAWLIVVPALQITVYGLIFGLVLGDSRPNHFLPYLITGIVLFQFIADSFSGGSKSIISNASLVRSLNFPRVLLPLSVVIAEIYMLLPLVVIMVVGIWAVGEPVSLAWFKLIPVLILMFFFGFGLSMLAARLTTTFADLNQLIPFITRVAFYSSGIFFSVDTISGVNPILGFLLEANPIHIFLKIARSILVTGYSATHVDWILAASWAVGTMLVGFIFFWRAEEKYGRIV
jgi:teichoic acid transport system permease protein